jgi:hypothetical protein
MTLSGIAKEAVLSLNLILDGNVGVNEITYSDWNGETRILVIEGESVAEDETQFEVLNQRTTLTVFCLSADRDEAVSLCQQAAAEVFRVFSEMTDDWESKILYIGKQKSDILNLPDQNIYKAARTFDILNSINL